MKVFAVGEERRDRCGLEWKLLRRRAEKKNQIPIEGLSTLAESSWKVIKEGVQFLDYDLLLSEILCKASISPLFFFLVLAVRSSEVDVELQLG